MVLAVDRAVTSNNRDPWLESRHRQNFYIKHLHLQLGQNRQPFYASPFDVFQWYTHAANTLFLHKNMNFIKQKIQKTETVKKVNTF